MLKKLRQFFTRYARGRGVSVAEKLAAHIRKKLGVRAMTRRTASGRLVAVSPAVHGQPPRLITGKLQRSVKVQKRVTGASVVVLAPYARALEEKGHAFFKPSLEELGLA